MASISARKNRAGTVSYRVQYRKDGKMRQETFPTMKGAHEFSALLDRVGPDAAREVRLARLKRTVGIPTLQEWTEEYLAADSGWLTGVTDATREGYQQIARRTFLPSLGPLPLDAISKQDVAKWVAWQERQPSARNPKTPVSAKSVKNYHSVLSAVLKAAQEAGHVASNPAHRVKLTRGRKIDMVLITEAEFYRIHDHMPPHYRPLAEFLVHTGMRWGEATALTWGDIDESAPVHTARITKAWKRGVGGVPVLGTPKTQKSIRTVALWAELVKIMGERGPADQLVFRGMEGGRMWSERFHKSAWNPAVEQVNRETPPLGKYPRVHDLRHAQASWLIADGAPLPYIQARLGHEKITTTVDTYGHLLPDAHEQLSRMASRRMRPVEPVELQALSVGGPH